MISDSGMSYDGVAVQVPFLDDTWEDSHYHAVSEEDQNNDAIEGDPQIASPHLR